MAAGKILQTTYQCSGIAKTVSDKVLYKVAERTVTDFRSFAVLHLDFNLDEHNCLVHGRDSSIDTRVNVYRRWCKKDPKHDLHSLSTLLDKAQSETGNFEVTDRTLRELLCMCFQWKYNGSSTTHSQQEERNYCSDTANQIPHTSTCEVPIPVAAGKILQTTYQCSGIAKTVSDKVLYKVAERTVTDFRSFAVLHLNFNLDEYNCLVHGRDSSIDTRVDIYRRWCKKDPKHDLHSLSTLLDRAQSETGNFEVTDRTLRELLCMCFQWKYNGSSTTHSPQEERNYCSDTANQIPHTSTREVPIPVADPGFPVGGGGTDPLGGGCQPLMHTLFSKNVCENERNGSCWGGAPAAPTPGSANGYRQ